MKISEFLEKKIINFKTFINDQFEKVNIEKEKQNKLLLDLDNYHNNINMFIQSIIQLSNYDLDVSIKLFLLNYEIDINEIKEHIDYDKLKRYLQMFIDIVKK